MIDKVRGFFDTVFRKNRCFVTFGLIVINVGIFIWMVFESGSLEFKNPMFMYRHGAMLLTRGIWIDENKCSILKAMFLHFDFEHLLSNMVSLALIGSTLEQRCKSIAFLVIYMGGGLAGNLLSLWVYESQEATVVSAGASGAVFALIGAVVVYAIVLRRSHQLGEKGMTEMIGVAAIMLYYAFRGGSSANINNYAHGGGFVAGFLLAWICYGIQAVRYKKKLQYGWYEYSEKDGEEL